MAASKWASMAFMVILSLGISSAHRVPPTAPVTAETRHADKPDSQEPNGIWSWGAGIGFNPGQGINPGGGSSGDASGGGGVSGGIGGQISFPGIGGNTGNPAPGGGGSGGGGGGNGGSRGFGSGFGGGGGGGGGEGSGGGGGGGGEGRGSGGGGIGGGVGFTIPGLGFGPIGGPIYCVPASCYNDHGSDCYADNAIAINIWTPLPKNSTNGGVNIQNGAMPPQSG